MFDNITRAVTIAIPWNAINVSQNKFAIDITDNSLSEKHINNLVI